ncbi:MAG: type II secretion system protein GspG [Phycisphaerae bacterium]|nr:type II secretion system protein GspG [Phycisphaerae bacterium]
MTTHRSSRRRVRRAFTILELLIVIGILLAIGGLVLVNILGASEKADVGNARLQLQAFEQAMEQFRAEMKRWPSEDEGIAVLWTSSSLESDEDRERWGGPYLKKPAPKDLWGHEWVYRQPSEVEGLEYDLLSVGPDGEEGTEDDISVHEGRVGEDGSVDEDFGDMDSGSTSGG